MRCFKKSMGILLVLSVLCGLLVLAVPVAADTYSCTVENTPYYFYYNGQTYQKGSMVFSASGTLYNGGSGFESEYYVGTSDLYDRYFVVFVQAKVGYSDYTGQPMGGTVTLNIDHSYIGHPREIVDIYPSYNSWGSTCTTMFLANTSGYPAQTNNYRISLSQLNTQCNSVEYKIVVFSYYR